VVVWWCCGAAQHSTTHHTTPHHFISIYYLIILLYDYITILRWWYYFEISDELRTLPSPLKQEQWMRATPLSTLKMDGTCAGGGHPVSKKNTAHSGVV